MFLILKTFLTLARIKTHTHTHFKKLIFLNKENEDPDLG